MSCYYCNKKKIEFKIRILSLKRYAVIFGNKLYICNDWCKYYIHIQYDFGFTCNYSFYIIYYYIFSTKNIFWIRFLLEY